MIKAFISHSHAQKDFALELVEKLGRDYCIIDCYDFQPAYRSMDQIYGAQNEKYIVNFLKAL